ncbi:hypothetical protein ACOSP7_028516 [Xanthoceras sorbifolium]|uniref:X8 domain-containing protein n=1 Tax=Xanthoceras sorbifolium TaxID=99658 RepID=A0ABQ8HCU5_9ROSI|nr:hypothetical protein JRO89_XS12G0162500 [Xanthoceras sorbifolium]
METTNVCWRLFVLVAYISTFFTTLTDASIQLLNFETIHKRDQSYSLITSLSPTPLPSPDIFPPFWINPPLPYTPQLPFQSPSPSPNPPEYAPTPPTSIPTPRPPIYQPPVVYPPPSVPPPPHKRPQNAVWCVAKPTVPDPIIQEAMDYACGSGADCKSIEPNGPCYQPNTMFAHASFAFNSYWQNAKVGGGTCDFGGTAMLVNVDPSFDDCHFIYY